MNWRARMAGYHPTRAEMKMDVYLRMPEEAIAYELAALLLEARR